MRTRGNRLQGSAMLNSWLRKLTRSRQIPVPIHVPARKSGIASRHSEPLPANAADCPELLVPLTPRPDMPALPAVKQGDHVGPLTALAQPGSNHAILAFSPAEAEVTGLATVDTEYACELPAVRLRLSAQAVWPPPMPAPALHEMSAKPAAGAARSRCCRRSVRRAKHPGGDGPDRRPAGGAGRTGRSDRSRRRP